MSKLIDELTKQFDWVLRNLSMTTDLQSFLLGEMSGVNYHKGVALEGFKFEPKILVRLYFASDDQIPKPTDFEKSFKEDWKHERETKEPLKYDIEAYGKDSVTPIWSTSCEM